MIYVDKKTGERVTRHTMQKRMFESYGNSNPDELAITEHFLLSVEDWEMGQIVITTHLNNEIENNPDAQREIAEAFNRYKMYDWGDSDRNDQEENDQAILKADRRILASYTLNSLNKEIWIITEWDRSVTTLLFPEDY